MVIKHLPLNCHHRNDSCIKMGIGESDFTVSLAVKCKVTRQCPHTGAFEENLREPKWNRTEVLLLTSLMPYQKAKLAPM